MRVLTKRPARRCAVCHDDLAPAAGRACSRCATRGHRACLAELGCPTLGCPGEPRLPLLVPRPWFDVRVLPVALFEAAVGIGFSIALAISTLLLLAVVANG